MRDGELFLFVNDAKLPVLALEDVQRQQRGHDNSLAIEASQFRCYGRNRPATDTPAEPFSAVYLLLRMGHEEAPRPD
jgi:hypothetical protein